MPRGDGTGPNVQGPMTGRKAGFCAGNAQQGFISEGRGRGGLGNGGWGRFGSGGGCGGRRGRRNRFFATGLTGMQAMELAMSNEDDLAMLKQQSADMEQALLQMKTKIQSMEKSSERAQK